MTGSCFQALSRVHRSMTVGLATALVVGLALVAAPRQAATAASSPPGTRAQSSADTGAQTSAHATKKRKKKSRGLRALRRVKSQAGDPYSYGANGPHAFDCSGLTQWVYKGLGHKLPHSSSGQVSHTFKVKRPRKGDLVFFYGGGGVYHVGIYAGKHDGRRWVWHAPRSGETVKKDPIWTDSHVIRRVKYNKH